MREAREAGWTFRCGPAVVRFERSGELSGVRTSARPDLDFVIARALPSATLSVGGGSRVPLRLERVEVRGDLDELDVVSTDPGPVRLALRHTFVLGWRIRWAVTNVGEERLRVSDVVLPLQAGPGCIGWALAAGAEARYSLHPRDGGGPLLAGRLRQGSVRGIGLDGLHVTDFELTPGGRYVLDWDWEWYESPLACAAAHPPVLPVTTVATIGTTISLTAGPDVAVLAPPSVEVDTSEDRYEFSAPEPGRHRVELRSARGVTALDLQWAPAAEQVVGDSALQAMSSDTSPAGVVRLPGLHAALVVQRAAAQGTLEVEAVEDALDLFTARLLGDAPLADPLAAVYLCGEFERTSDPDLLDAATRLVLESPLAAGLGVAATRVCLARLVAGLPFGAVAQRARQLAWPRDPGALLGAPVAEQLSVAELLIVSGSSTTGSFAAARSPTAGSAETQYPSGVPAQGDLLGRLVLALGLHLGAGLPGSGVPPLPPDRLGQLLTVFMLLPEPLGTSTRSHWGVSARQLAERALPRLVERLGPEPVGPGHGWLAVLTGLE